tara:strand:+ start:5794 stop:5979 length:186 start_codon:yes stop_codon:yes gene_type:complete
MPKKNMQWEVREVGPDRWGIFLKQEFCRTDESVCYAAGRNKASIEQTVERMNDPMYWVEDE